MSRAFIGMPAFPVGAKEALNDPQLRSNLRHATTTIRDKRSRVIAELPDWEDLRLSGAAIKDDVGRHLDRYLEQFEAEFTAAGGHVHWARDAAEAQPDRRRPGSRHRRDRGRQGQVDGHRGVRAERGPRRSRDHRPRDRPRGAHRQLAGDLPSHILVPAIHLSRGEIREIFLENMSGVRDDLTTTLLTSPAAPARTCASGSCQPRSGSPAPTS